MSQFKTYSPDQAYLLPPSVRDEWGANHLCFFVRGVVERLDMTVFEQSYSVEGGELYAPQLMLGVWLYAYALGITSARRLCARLHGRDRGLGQSSDRGPAGDAERDRQRLAAAHDR